MATYYFRNVTGNWNTASSWSLTSGGGATGAVPTSSDNVIFDSNSGACTLSTTAGLCASISFSSYTNTLTLNIDIRVSGNVTFTGNSITVAGSGNLNFYANTPTITSNSNTWGGNIAISIATLFADDFTALGSCSITGLSVNPSSGTGTVNLYVGGSLTTGTFSGAVIIILTGTGTVTCSSLRNTGLTINSSGTITFATSSFLVLSSNTFTFTYTAGTVAFGSSTLTFTGNTGAGSFIFNNVSSLTFNTVVFTILGATYTLNSDMNITTFQYTGNGNANNTITINGSNLNIGGLTTATVGATNSILGTSTIVAKLGGTITGNTNLTLKNNFSINCGSNTTTFAGTFVYSTGTLTYITGTVSFSSSTLFLSASCTLNTSSVSWSNITISAAATITLNSTLTISNVLSILANTSFIGNYGFNVYSLTSTLPVTITLKSSNTYTITNNLACYGTYASHSKFVSSVGGTTTALTLNAGASQTNLFLDATDVNSSAGQLIWSFLGVFSNSSNWVAGIQPAASSYIFMT